MFSFKGELVEITAANTKSYELQPPLYGAMYELVWLGIHLGQESGKEQFMALPCAENFITCCSVVN